MNIKIKIAHPKTFVIEDIIFDLYFWINNFFRIVIWNRNVINGKTNHVREHSMNDSQQI